MLQNLKNKISLYTFLGIFLWSLNAIAQYTIPEIPKFQTSVYDYAKLLDDDQKKNLEEKLIRYSDTTSTQIVVVIIESLKNEDKSQLATRWAHSWGVGQAKEDNGVFILLAVKERQIDIRNGYGVEDRLSSGITGEIIRNEMIPYFKNEQYYEGLDSGTEAIFKVLKGKYKGTRKANKNSESIPAGVAIFFILVIIILIISLKKGGGNNNNRGGGGLDLSDIIILSSLGRRNGSGFGGGGFSGGGSFGGGGFGGGFGGGGFSGGGAGGSW